MLTRHVTDDGRIVRAYDRARTYPHNAIKRGAGVYSVKSEHDPRIAYTVQEVNGDLVCNCRAAQYGKPCKHAARVAMRIARRK